MNKFITLSLLSILTLSACHSNDSGSASIPSPVIPVQTEPVVLISTADVPDATSLNIVSTGSEIVQQKIIVKNDLTVSVDFSDLNPYIQTPESTNLALSVDSSLCSKVLAPGDQCELTFSLDPSKVAGTVYRAYVAAGSYDQATGTNQFAVIQVNALVSNPGLAPQSPYVDGTLEIAAIDNSGSGVRYLRIQNASNGPVKNLKLGSFGQLTEFVSFCSDVLLPQQTCAVFLKDSSASDPTAPVDISYTATDYNGHDLTGTATTHQSTSNVE